VFAGDIVVEHGVDRLARREFVLDGIEESVQRSSGQFMSAFERLNLGRRADHFILNTVVGLLRGKSVPHPCDVVVPPVGDCALGAIPIHSGKTWDRPSPPIR